MEVADFNVPRRGWCGWERGGSLGQVPKNSLTKSVSHSSVRPRGLRQRVFAIVEFS